MRAGWWALVLRSGSALLAGGLGFTAAMDLVDTEAGGGVLTEKLIWMCLAGSVLLLVCAALVFTRRAGVVALTLVGGAACLPLFVYRVAPSLVSWVSAAPASVVPDRFAVFDPVAVCGLVAVGLLGLVHARVALWTR